MRRLLFPAGLAVLLLVGCQGGDSDAYVMLKGKRLTESDLKSGNPDQYKQLRKQYNGQVLSMLKNLANQKMIEMEAKEHGLPPQQYVNTVVESAGLPSEAEIQARYQELKAGGQVQESLGQIKEQLAMMMMRENRDKLMTKELARLRKKYEYNLPRNDVKVADEPTRVSGTPKVTIVEFSDFECPYCQRFQKTSKEIREKYGDRVQWVFKDFPLDFHKSAMGAHIAANCVWKQNKDAYWKYFDGVFSTERAANALATEALEQRAFSLGLNMDQFRACAKDPDVEKEIKEDMKEGEALGVNGTPAFFVNGRMLTGALPFEEFQGIIDDELGL